MTALLSASGVWKEFPQPGTSVTALADVTLAIGRGEFVVVTGESGSGKSTLLSLLAGMDRPTRGAVRFDDEALESAAPGRLARIRRERMGFVFQDFRLVRHLTVLGNVRLPLLFGGRGGDADEAERLLEGVNIAHRARHRPDALSRGEMQRAALARALANRPDVLFADEPTANLDRRNAGILWKLIADLHRGGLTVVAAAHDVEVIPEGRRIVRLDDGRIASDEHR